MRAYQATAAEVIHQYAGHIAQYLGDGLLVYFGWPVAHEDDALRGVHAGLGIVEAITTTLNPHLQQEKGVQLAVRIGLHTGPVVVGEMGGGGRHEHLATGDTVHIAARLEGLAAPNTVVVSPVTARLVRQAVALDDLGPYELKGVTEPMHVFRVLRPLETQTDQPAVAGVPFLVGRAEELGLLRRCWAQAKERLGQVVLLSGTAGLGKSALTEVLRAQVRDEGWPRMAVSLFGVSPKQCPVSGDHPRGAGPGHAARGYARDKARQAGAGPAPLSPAAWMKWCRCSRPCSRCRWTGAIRP